MASKTEEKLLRDLEMHRAMVLDKYPAPQPLDRKLALETTKDRTRFDQPQVHAWTISPAGQPVFGWFNKARDSFGKVGKEMLNRNWYDNPVLALIATRNEASHVYATLLLGFDKEIATHLAGSGIMPGVIVSKADAPIQTTGAGVQADGVMTARVDGNTATVASEPVPPLPEATPANTPPAELSRPTGKRQATQSKASATKENSNAVRKSAAKAAAAQSTKKGDKK